MLDQGDLKNILLLIRRAKINVDEAPSVVALVQKLAKLIEPKEEKKNGTDTAAR